jgi:hypothetical protein
MTGFFGHFCLSFCVNSPGIFILWHGNDKYNNLDRSGSKVVEESASSVRVVANILNKH